MENTNNKLVIACVILGRLEYKIDLLIKLLYDEEREDSNCLSQSRF